MSVMACTGLRQLEVVCRATLGPPTLTHATDSCYWAFVRGVCKKDKNFRGHDRPLLERREVIVDALARLRQTHFAEVQEIADNCLVSSKCCQKINRAIRKAWPFSEVAVVTSHFFRSFYVAATHANFNQKNSLAAWATDVLAHENLETSHAYTTLLITGFGTIAFDHEQQLQGLAKLRI